MVKGLAYSLEVIVSLLVLLIFSYGAVEFQQPQQDWSEYQREISASDLTYSLQASGKMTQFLKKGGIGSIQNSVYQISDRNLELSGTVSNLPIYEISLGYYTRPENRYNESIRPVESGDRCYGELEEIKNFVDDPVENPIYRTDGDLEKMHNVSLYFANTNPTGLPQGADSSRGYDTLWVDNSTEDERCQFSSEEGPFYLDQFFMWGDSNTTDPNYFYDFENVKTDSSIEKATFYNASRPNKLLSEMDKGINNITTYIDMDVVSFSEIQEDNYDTLIFEERESLGFAGEESINTINNSERLEKHLSEGSSVLFLMNLTASDFDNGLLKDSKLEWLNVSYKDNGYSGGLSNISFTDAQDSISLKTNLLGQNSTDVDVNRTEIAPPGKVISEGQNGPTSSGTLIAEDKNYNLSEAGIYLKSEEFDDGKAEEVSIPGSEYNFTVKVDDSGSQKYRAKFDKGANGTYETEWLINGDSVSMANKTYTIQMNCSNTCLNLSLSANDRLELLPHTSTFDSFSSTGDLAVLNFRSNYTESQAKLVSSTVFWLSDRQYGFVGREEPQGVDTRAVGSINDKTYMPYSLSMRWSR